jgi:hypothetical protein
VGTVSPEDIEQRFEAYRPRVMRLNIIQIEILT